MQATLVYARTTLGFLSGALALASAFVIVMTIAVLHSNTSHGTPTVTDYWFAAALLTALTIGFASGAAVVGRPAISLLPTRIAAITGAGAVALLLITMMLIGESLRETGSIVAGFAVGGLAAGVSIRWWRANVLR